MVAGKYSREPWKELTTKATAAFFRHKFDEAERCLQEALPLAHAKGPTAIAAILKELAALYADTDRYDAARLTLDKAVEVLANLPAQREAVRLLSAIGLRYTQMDLYEDALRVEKKRQSVVRRLPEREEVIEQLYRETEEEIERIRQDKHEHDALVDKLTRLFADIPIEVPKIEEEAARATVGAAPSGSEPER
jgi:tetratricopeptide (TPR) repeat protein